jgi:hypothetical protein
MIETQRLQREAILADERKQHEIATAAMRTEHATAMAAERAERLAAQKRADDLELALRGEIHELLNQLSATRQKLAVAEAVGHPPTTAAMAQALAAQPAAVPDPGR